MFDVLLILYSIFRLITHKQNLHNYENLIMTFTETNCYCYKNKHTYYYLYKKIYKQIPHKFLSKRLLFIAFFGKSLLLKTKFKR